MLERTLNSLQNLWQGISQLPLLHRTLLGGVTLTLFLSVLSMTLGSWWMLLYGLLVAAAVLLLLVGVNAVVRRLERRNSTALAGALQADEEPSILPDEDRQQALAEIREQWSRSLGELDRAGMHVYSMPWFMLIGEPGSGKTTTLRNSGLEFPVGTEALSGFGGTRNCDWWFTNEAVILDTAGRFTFEERNAPDRDQWNEFLALLQRYRPRGPINGVLVAIPATSLLKDSAEELERKARNIREKLLHLENELEVQFPVFFLVTKCDLVLGFNEFFSRLPALEQRQLFGWSKPHPYDAPVDHGAWPEVFSGLQQTLERWRLRFLSEDPDAGDIDALYAFPDEFAALQAPLATTLQEIFVDNRYVDPLFLRGLYFTSGMQKGRPIAKACAALLGENSDGDSRHFSETFEKSTAFFIRDFYVRKLFRERGLIRPTRRAQKRRQLVQRIGFSSVAILGLILTFLTVYGGYRQSQAVQDPRDTLAALVETPNTASTRQWLDNAAAYTESVEKVAAGSLSHNFLQRWAGGEQLDTLLAELSSANAAILGEHLFRRFGEAARTALSIAPTQWEDYVLYENAARNYFALLREEPTRDGTENLEDPGDHLDPLTQLLITRGTPLTRVEDFGAIYRRMVLLHRQAGLPRPQFTPSFADSSGSADSLSRRVLDNIASYWQGRVEGSTPLTVADCNAMGEALAIPLLWQRLSFLDQYFQQVTQELERFDPALPETLEQARTQLNSWLSQVDPSSDAQRGSDRGYAQGRAEVKSLLAHRNALPNWSEHRSHLEQRWRQALDTLGTLPAPVVDALSTQRQRLEAASNTVTTTDAFAARQRGFAIEVSEPNAEGDCTLRLNVGDGAGRRGDRGNTRGSNSGDSDKGAGAQQILAVAQTVRQALQAEFDADHLSTLHVELPKFLESSETVLAAAAASNDPLSASLAGVLRLAYATFATTQLQGYRRYGVSHADQELAMISGFMPKNSEPTVQLLHLGSTSVQIDSRLHHDRASDFLKHSVELLHWIQQNRDLLLEGEAKRFRAAVLVACRGYFDAYRKGWQQVIASFRANLEDLEETRWSEFTRRFKRDGLGVASTGADVGERFAQLVKIVRQALDFSRWLHMEDQDPIDAELREILDEKIFGYFANFLEAYPSRDNVEEQISSAYDELVAVVRRLSASYPNPEDRFLALLKPAAEGAPLPRELLARCEERILASETLRADELTGELLRIVQLPRQILERELTQNFEERWERFGNRYYNRISGRYPFENSDAANKVAPDVPQATFQTLYNELRAEVRPWLPFLETPNDRSARVRLRLNRPEILLFCDRVEAWGTFLGFSRQTSRELPVTLTLNYHDAALSSSLDPVSAERTDLQAIIGSLADQHIFGGGLSPQVPFTWHFDSATQPTLSFTLLRLGELDEATRWPSSVDHPPGWLTLPRLLLEYSDQDWAQSRIDNDNPDAPRTEWVVRQLTQLPDRGAKQYVMYYHFALPPERGLPKKPELVLTGWRGQR